MANVGKTRKQLEIIPLDEKNCWEYKKKLCDNRYLTVKCDVCSLIDDQGSVLANWDMGLDYLSYKSGPLPVGSIEFKSKYGYYDFNGKLIIPMEWDYGGNFYEGLARVTSDGKWGFISEDGEVVIPVQWDDARDFRNRLAAVKSGGKWGFINKNGEVVIPMEWDGAWNFREGLAVVKLNSGYVKLFDDYGFINKDGEIVLPLEWDNIYRIGEGEYLVKKGDNPYIARINGANE